MERDSPIHKTSDDRFGFKDIAEKIAGTIRQNIKGDGLVIGIEGPWGSGKTSLLNLIAECLEKNSASARPGIVRFEPWIVSNGDAMMESLFEEILVCLRDVKANRLGAIAALPEQVSNFGLRVQKAAKLLQNYSRHLKIAGKLIPGVSGVVDIGQTVVDYLADGPAKLSLVEQKAELCNAIRELDCGIVVIVDDLDRLEPGECIEILRLVRAVADFPNITYLIGYDQIRVATAIEGALKVTGGRAYLEKLFQANFAVPKIDRFDLHGMLKERIAKLFPKLDSYIERRSGVDNGWLSEVISTEGEVRISTPRDVVRLVNHLTLYVQPIVEKIDIADATWLHLIFSKNPDLFRWIERYCRFAWHNVSGDLQPEAYETSQLVSELNRILESDGAILGNRKYLWQRVLPTMSFGLDDKVLPQKIELFKGLHAGQKSDLATAKRLASPVTGPLYFQFAEATGTLSDSEYSTLKKEIERDAKTVCSTLLKLISRKRPQGGLIADLFLERLSSDSQIKFSSAHKDFILAIVEIADDLAIDGKYIVPHRPFSWLHCNSLLKQVLGVISPAERQALIETAFSKGKSIEYLSDLLRSETSSHDLNGNDWKPQEAWVLTEEQYNIARTKLAVRFTNLSLKELLALREPLNVLYAWKQAGFELEVKNWVRNVSAADDDFLSLLESMRTIRQSSKGSRLVLQLKYVSDFFDSEAAMKRLEELASGSSSSKGLQERAAQVLEALKKGRDL